MDRADLNDSIRRHIKAVIEQEMEAQGISHSLLCKKAGISSTGIRDVLQAKNAPRVDTLLKISGALGIPPRALIPAEIGETEDVDSELGAQHELCSKTVSSRIRHFRKIAGLTQTELGERIGKEQTALARIESGKQLVPLDLVSPTANALGVSVQELLGFDAPENKIPTDVIVLAITEVISLLKRTRVTLAPETIGELVLKVADQIQACPNSAPAAREHILEALTRQLAKDELRN